MSTLFPYRLAILFLIFFTGVALLLAQLPVRGVISQVVILWGSLVLGAAMTYGVLKAEVNRLTRLSSLDPVTGLYQSQVLHKLLNYDIERSRRYQRELSIILLDIDDFTAIQEAQGQHQAESVLVFLSRIILDGIEYTDKKKKEFHGIRHSDIAFRYDEQDRILIIMPETGAKGAYIAAERIREAVMFTPFPAARKGDPLRISLSAGVASFDVKTDTTESLLTRVDLLLRKAKITRNHVAIENPIHRELPGMEDPDKVTPAVS